MRYTLHSELGDLVVSALDFQVGYRGFEFRSGRDNFQTISTPTSYSTCPGLSIKWTGRRLVTDSGSSEHKYEKYQFFFYLKIFKVIVCFDA